MRVAIEDLPETSPFDAAARNDAVGEESVEDVLGGGVRVGGEAQRRQVGSEYEWGDEPYGSPEFSERDRSFEWRRKPGASYPMGSDV